MGRSHINNRMQGEAQSKQQQVPPEGRHNAKGATEKPALTRQHLGVIHHKKQLHVQATMIDHDSSNQRSHC